MSVDGCSRIMITPVFILLICAVLTFQASAQKVLVLVDDPLLRSTHSLYFSDLTSRGYDIAFKSASDRKLQLKDWDDWLYDKIVIFAPSATGVNRFHAIACRDCFNRLMVVMLVLDGHLFLLSRLTFRGHFRCLYERFIIG